MASDDGDCCGLRGGDAAGGGKDGNFAAKVGAGIQTTLKTASASALKWPTVQTSTTRALLLLTKAGSVTFWFRSV